MTTPAVSQIAAEALLKPNMGRKIIHFFCRPCGEYHLKPHPHYGAMKRRAAKRRKAIVAFHGQASKA
jgi:hypothetical protein